MFNNLNPTLKKIVVIFLIITLTYANLILVGSNIVKGLISYALEENEENLVVAEQELIMNKVCEINGEQKRIIQVAIQTGIESENYPIKETTLTLNKNIIEQTLEDVKVTELNKNSYTTGNWAEEEGKIKIFLTNENEILENKEKGIDKLLVTYVFQESEIETIKKPLEKVETKTYGNEVLTKESEESNFEEINKEKDIMSLNIVNSDIHKTTIPEEGKVEYTEKLKFDLSYRKEVSNITIEDEQNIFYNNNEQEDNEIVLKYKTTKINKEELLKLLGEEGKIVLKDTVSNKTLVEFTKETIEKEQLNVKTEQKFVDEEKAEEEIRSNVTVTDKEIVIEYVIDVTNFKLELINIKAQSENEIEPSDFIVENTKAISNINNLEELNYLQENVKYLIDETEKNIESKITFKDTITKASLSVDNTEWKIGEANKVKYTVTLNTSSEKTELFVNPMFLIELPSSVESVNTAKSEFVVNNNNDAFTNKKVFVTTVLDRKFVVITLEGNQTAETIANGDATIDLTLELNVVEAAGEGNETTKLYYQNDTVTTYESGKGFDTAEVTVSMIMESEPKDEIQENSSNVTMLLTTSAKEIIKPNEEFEYTVYLYNFDSAEKHNLQLNSILPEGISIVKIIEMVDSKEIEKEYYFDEATRNLTINIDKLEGATEKVEEETSYTEPTNKVFKIKVKADDLQDGTFSKEIKNRMKVQDEDKVLAESKEVVNIVSDTILIIETENLPEQINETDNIILGMKITNQGLVNALDIDVAINIPEEISLNKYSKTILSLNGQEESKDEGTLSNTIFEEDNIIIPSQKTYYLQLIGKVDDIKETKQVTIKGTANGEEFSWTVKLVDITDDGTETPENPEDPANPSNPEDPVNPNNPENPTNPNKPTAPENPQNPSDSGNQGETGENEKKEFDLELKQYLNKITVTNAKGTTTYNYKDTNFAKIEIHSKYMNGSKVTLEYKVVVKNEGTIPGYARKIVDYIPEDLKFNQELNKDWFLGDDGNIYTIALIDKLLNPGETAELNIVLEKQMTNENVGTIKNLVEIYEASNDEDVNDINSIPGDKIEGQNDMSKVEVIVATSTGTIILYTTLTIVVITILGYGLYRVKKVTLNKKGGC